jgi:DNA-binding protein YbaB
METGESMDAAIAEARAQLESTKAAVARARSELGDASTTARSKDRSVEVTVGPQGELKRVKFLADKYRTMEAAQLGASIVEAANKGRAAMARRVIDTFSGITAPGVSGDGPDEADLPGYTPDWERIFGSALAGGKRRRGVAARTPRNGRSAAAIHDEIVEDES